MKIVADVAILNAQKKPAPIKLQIQKNIPQRDTINMKTPNYTTAAGIYFCLGLLQGLTKKEEQILKEEWENRIKLQIQLHEGQLGKAVYSLSRLIYAVNLPNAYISEKREHSSPKKASKLINQNQQITQARFHEFDERAETTGLLELIEQSNNPDATLSSIPIESLHKFISVKILNPNVGSYQVYPNPGPTFKNKLQVKGQIYFSHPQNHSPVSRSTRPSQ